jgi:hypothetical protein
MRVFLQLPNDSIDDFIGAALATQVRSADLAFQQNAVDGSVDLGSGASVTQVGEQQCSGPERQGNEAVSSELVYAFSLSSE